MTLQHPNDKIPLVITIFFFLQLMYIFSLGVARGRGVLYGPEEVKVAKYSWGSRCMKNKQGEAYALYQGIQLAKEKQVTSLIVLGDFLLLIQHLVKGYSPRDKTLDSLMKRIRKVQEWFSLIAYFHVLCYLNKDATLCANKGCKIRLGDLQINA